MYGGGGGGERSAGKTEDFVKIRLLNFWNLQNSRHRVSDTSQSSNLIYEKRKNVKWFAMSEACCKGSKKNSSRSDDFQRGKRKRVLSAQEITRWIVERFPLESSRFPLPRACAISCTTRLGLNLRLCVSVLHDNAVKRKRSKTLDRWVKKKESTEKLASISVKDISTLLHATFELHCSLRRFGF